MDSSKRLPSPPRPRRLLMMPEQAQRPSVPGGFVIPQITTSPAPATWSMPKAEIDSFESQMVDRAMSNLPNVLSEVFNIQKGQANDIQTLQQMVQENKSKLTVAEGNRDELLQEISSITKRIYMTEENIKENGKACKSLKSDIESLVIDLYENERKVSQQREDIELEKRKLQQHRLKKTKFAQEVDEHETKTSEIQKKMNELNESLNTLKEQKRIMEKDLVETDRIKSGRVALEIQSDLDNLKKKIQDAEDGGKIKESQIVKEKEKHHQINQTMQVLQKRNAAQLTRLRRQLKDVQMQNKQWTQQIANLELKINQIRSEEGAN